MSTSSARRVAPRVLALLLAPALALGLSGTAVAKGKPVKPSVPTDLTIGVTYAGGSYRVPLTWKAGANTTSFIATLTGGGVTLATASLTATSWTPTITAKAGTIVTAQVAGMNGKFRGPAATASVRLPDVTPPVGSYEATWGDPVDGRVTVTFRQLSLSDDVSSREAVQVAVDFGDTGSLPTNGGLTTFTHSYAFPADAVRYEPRIRLTDAAGNSSYAAVNAVVFNDHEAPTGTVKVSATSGWARWSRISLNTTAADNLSPAARIRRTIGWGDGTTSVAYGDGPLRHVYVRPGSYRPSVTFADEARPANTSAAVKAPAVTIRADVYRPTVTLTLPQARRRSVRSWVVLRGTAHDGQTAIASVRVKAVEKRGHAFYAYLPARHTWVKVGRKARAFATAGYLRVPTAGAWRVRLRRLTKGVLVYRVQAVDVIGNVSATYGHRQRLTGR